MSKKNETRPAVKDVVKMLESGELVERYQDMVYDLAHKMAAQHPNERFDELVAEGYWGLMEFVPKYDPRRASINTWVYKCIWGSMKTFCINPKTHRHIPTDMTDPVFEVEAKEPWLPSLLRELNEDAKLLVIAALEAPGELAYIIRDRAPSSSRYALCNYMKNTLGWNDNQLNTAWMEVAECL